MTEITPGSGPAGDSPSAGEPGASRGTVPVQGSAEDLPSGSATGADRATDQATAEVVGARRPLDIGQGLALPESTAAATVGTATLLGIPKVGQAVTPAFDEHHPPDAALIGDCVHCGFCLPTCPTYVLWGEEMDSPRGRIYLMKEGLEGEPLDDSMVRHFDQCLGCLACVTACPSGVQYDKLIEAVRPQVERRYRRPRSEKFYRDLIYNLFPYPRRLRVLRGPLRAYQASRLGSLLTRSGLMSKLPAPLQAMETLAPKLGKA
ncbi:MAG: 4Fe-4S dicluster domain-containing protein, partial [Actinomycetes bacterium]